MEQNAKKLLKRISNQVSTLTDKKISQVAHAPKENEWRAYMWQRRPHWEDIAWRVKEPNAKGDAEVHLGFYSAKPNEEFSQAIERAEYLAKGKVSHLIKNENGIRLVWKTNLNDEKAVEILFLKIYDILPDFISIALGVIIKVNTENKNDGDDIEGFILTNPQTGRRFIIAEKDLPTSEWIEAESECTKLGLGWRLPTIYELKLMYDELFVNGIGEFEEQIYWSSTESDEEIFDENNEDFAIGYDFYDNNYVYWMKQGSYQCVRAVKDLD